MKQLKMIISKIVNNEKFVTVVKYVIFPVIIYSSMYFLGFNHGTNLGYKKGYRMGKYDAIDTIEKMMISHTGFKQKDSVLVDKLIFSDTVIFNIAHFRNDGCDTVKTISQE
jgi:hypothetical protein